MVWLTAADRARLEAVVANRNSPQKRVWRPKIKRGVFRSIVELQVAINRFLAETNADPKPFVWTAHPDRLIAAVQRRTQALEALR
jgi:hypothetical protein